MTQAYNLAILANAVDTSGRLNVGTNATGTLPVANGGTGLTATPTNGQLDIGNGSGFTRATLTPGTGISITNGAGSITIASTVTGGVTSLNGQTGAITNTNFNSIGSYTAGTGYQATSNAGSTIAGSSIVQVQGDYGASPFNILTESSTVANQGQTGTWRAMARNLYTDLGCGNWRNGTNLWVRIS